MTSLFPILEEKNFGLEFLGHLLALSGNRAANNCALKNSQVQCASSTDDEEDKEDDFDDKFASGRVYPESGCSRLQCAPITFLRRISFP